MDGINITNNPNEIAQRFNDYFSSIAEELILKRKYEGKKMFTDYLKKPNNNSFYMFPTDGKEVLTKITLLNDKKSYGPVSIPTETLKLIKEEVCIPLSDIFNLSITNGVHPEKLRIAQVIPIFKKGSRLLPSNYRPISLLSNINRIREKLVFSRLHGFLELHNCLYSFQYGFRENHSTNHALIDISENIRNALDSNKSVCGIFVDFQKAFDTVNHDILLQKLEHYGIRGCTNSWFKSYLSQRKQFVSILGFESQKTIISHGVPQGSVLGPLLFLIYINDLHKAIKHSAVFKQCKTNHNLNTRSAECGLLFHPFVESTKYGKKSIKISSIKSWNFFAKISQPKDLLKLTRNEVKKVITGYFIASYE